MWLGPTSGIASIAAFVAYFASGPNTAPATVEATSLTSAMVFITCPTAFVVGALPIALKAPMASLPRKFTTLLLQEQTPLRHEVDWVVGQ